MSVQSHLSNFKSVALLSTHCCCPPVQYAEELLASKGSMDAKKELDLLTAIIKVSKPAAHDNFKLALFGDGDDDPIVPTKHSLDKVPELSFGTAGKNDTYRLEQVVKGLDLDGDQEPSTSDRDLLDLMDSVS